MRFTELQEAYSPVELQQIKDQVAEIFRARGLNVTVSPHLLVRLDQRMNLPLERVLKIFAAIALNDGIRKAFQRYDDNNRVTQKSRVIDFNDGNAVGSVQVDKKSGNKNYELETLYYGKYLTQGARAETDIRTMRAGIPRESGKLWVPTYNMGNFPAGDFVDLLRKTREQSHDVTGVNRHGFTAADALPRLGSPNVISATLTYIRGLIDTVQKASLGIGGASQEYTPEYAKELIQKTVRALSSLAKLKIVGIDQADTNQLTSLYNQISKLTTSQKQALSTGQKGWVKAFTSSLDEKINKSLGIKYAEYERVLRQYYDTQDPKIREQLAAIVQPFKQFVEQNNLLHSSAFGGDREGKDELGVPLTLAINPVTGNVGRDAAAAKARQIAIAKNRRAFQQQHGESVQQAVNTLNRVINAVLAQPAQQDSQEADFRELLKDAQLSLVAGSNEKAVEDIKVLLAQEPEGNETPLKQAVFGTHPQLRQIRGQLDSLVKTIERLNNQTQQTTAVTETIMNKNKLETYINMLIYELLDPSAREGIDDYGTDTQKFAIDSIPDEYRTAAKEEAFKRIISKMKQDPAFVEIVEQNAPGLTEWIPDGIFHKLINIGHELNLDDLDAHLKSQADVERRHSNVKHKGLPGGKSRFHLDMKAVKGVNESSTELNRLRYLSGLE